MRKNRRFETVYNIEKIDPATGKTPSVTKCGGVKPYVNSRGTVVRRASTINELNADLNKATASTGRYHMGYTWQRGGNTGAHIITVERLPDGNIRIYDPQSGEIIKWSKLVKEINTQYSVIVYRVDNLHVNTELINDVVIKAVE